MSRRPLAGTGRLDRWVAAGFVAAAVIEAVVRWHDQPIGLIVNLVGALGLSCFVLRRIHPLLLISIIAGLGVIEALILALLTPTASTNSDVAIIALVVAAYSLGVYGSRRALLLGAPQPVLTILAVDLLQPRDHPLASALPFAVLFVVVIPAVAGRLVRGRARLIERLRRQTAELEAHRAVWGEQELARERLRLSELFHEILLAGMRALADRVDAAAGSEAASAEDVFAIENAARNLLARTREAVVALNTTDMPEPEPAQPGTSPRTRMRRFMAQPWTALAAAGIGGGLLLELPSLQLQLAAPIAVLACVVLVLPLAFLWAAPLTMTFALWVLLSVFDAFVAPLDTAFTAIALAFVPPFAVAALATRPRAIAGLAACALGELACFGPSGLGDAAVIMILAWATGAVLHERGRLVDQLRRTAVLLGEQREAVTQQTALEERGRLARELHDALGHSLTVVTLQAEASRRLWQVDHGHALAVLQTLATATHAGLAELQFGFAPVTPVGRLLTADSLGKLVEAARLSALRVDAQFDDVTELLDDARQLVVYRILQESLTNVLKHAPGATVQVVIRSIGPYVDVAVTNAPGGQGQNRTTIGSGRGLVGMRERAASCGGELSWNTEPGGGFRVHARLSTALVPA